MSYSPYLFLKSYQERLHEFNCVLSNNLKARDVAMAWSNYLELAMEPVGWKAIWRISRVLCADYKINFPCTVIVIVEHVNFNNLSCSVVISEVDNDSIHLPQNMSDVPLIELYPTKEQDHSCVLAMSETANVIDNLRFFYHNLWMPWDLPFDEDISWTDAHLEGRLQLHYSMLELRVPEEVVDKVRRLVAEGRQTLERMEDLLDLDAEGDSELPPDQLLQLTELHSRLNQLRNDYGVYETPHLLKALLERQQNCVESKPDSTLVLSTTTADQLRNICNNLPEDIKQIRFVPTLQEALAKSPQQGSVIVSPGEHLIQDLASLKTGGSLTGLMSGVVLVGDISGDDCATLDLLKGCLKLSRLILRITSSWIIMKVRPSAEASLTDVQLQGSAGTDGVDVHPGATFTAVGCSFNNCQTALVCYPNSTVKLSCCTFTNNSIAIELREGCNFSMADCTISGSSVCGVKVLHPSPLVKQNNQSPPTIETINSISQLKETDTVCSNNTSDISFLCTTSNDCNGDYLKSEEKRMES